MTASVLFSALFLEKAEDLRLWQMYPRLTKRELEVLNLVSQGYSNKKISEELVLSEATVKSHLVHIYDKLGVRSRTAATEIAREWGIIF